MIKNISIEVCLVMLLCVSAVYAAPSAPVEILGQNKDMQLIRSFYTSINEGDNFTALNYACEAQKAIKKGNFGVGPGEVKLLDSKFPWRGLDLVQIEKLSGYYEVKLKGGSGVTIKNVTLGKEEGVDCIYLMK